MTTSDLQHLYELSEHALAACFTFFDYRLGEKLATDVFERLPRPLSALSEEGRLVAVNAFSAIAVVLRSAFLGAKRDGRGSVGDIKDGYYVKFSSAEKMEIAQDELERQGYSWELISSTGSKRLLLIDARFPIDGMLPET